MRRIYLDGRGPRAVHMHWRRFALADIPLADPAEFDAWLVERWREKDALLAYFAEHACFPGEAAALADADPAAAAPAVEPTEAAEASAAAPAPETPPEAAEEKKEAQGLNGAPKTSDPRRSSAGQLARPRRPALLRAPPLPLPPLRRSRTWTRARSRPTTRSSCCRSSSRAAGGCPSCGARRAMSRVSRGWPCLAVPRPAEPRPFSLPTHPLSPFHSPHSSNLCLFFPCQGRLVSPGMSLDRSRWSGVCWKLYVRVGSAACALTFLCSLEALLLVD